MSENCCGIVWKILIKSSYFGTITERIKNVFQKIAISGIVWQIFIKRYLF